MWRVSPIEQRGLAAVDRGLPLTAEAPWLMGVHGDPLAETDPAGTPSTHRVALSVAGARGSRTLVLSRRSRSPGYTNPAAAPSTPRHVLAPALEGFSPTPEMPEIAEAQAP